MSDGYQFNTRMNRHKKRKNNKKTTFYIVILSVIFISLLITFFIIITSDSNDDDKNQVVNNDNNGIENNGQNVNDDNEDAMINSNDNDEQENNNEDRSEDTAPSTNSDIENDTIDDVEIIDDSDDDNVIRTYIGKWEPIGTVQTGEHVTNFNNGSLDRIEIEKASSQVTGIPVDQIFTGWVGNNGHQKAFTIISNQEREEYYKIYLSWIDEQGWQVTRVEKIKEFDIDDYRS